ncbi:hypothetical protein V6N13_018767 [Hibiscus sabdariffa]|uniref:ABC transmembrane type-1 domain-containing protein n=1 Tax=Hibiscus sabdariffa TaxID=183260 RepID=A0ABR2EKZ0_9ROSI
MEETRELDRHLTESSEQVEHQMMKNTDMFFRIWLVWLKENASLQKIATGSIAAAFAGVSKPFYGFFDKDAKLLVGRYSIFVPAHPAAHYFYGVVGETSMANLGEALYSGILRNEVAWFEKPEENVASLTSRVINGTSIVKTIISGRTVSLKLIATVVSMVVNSRMGLVAWAVMPYHFIGGLIEAKFAKGFAGDSAAIHHKVVANIRTIASFLS